MIDMMSYDWYINRILNFFNSLENEVKMSSSKSKILSNFSILVGLYSFIGLPSVQAQMFERQVDQDEESDEGVVRDEGEEGGRDCEVEREDTQGGTGGSKERDRNACGVSTRVYL
jgi:hypothetical protein